MVKGEFRIVPMKLFHRKACEAIVNQSEPWLTLGEGVDFRSYITARQAYVCQRRSGRNTEVGGFIIFTSEPVFARGGYLRAIGVAPHERDRGIGRALVSFAEKRTAQRSQNFYLCVSSFNRQAQTFYKKLGYRKAGRLPDLLIPGESEYIYWKQLRPHREP